MSRGGEDDSSFRVIGAIFDYVWSESVIERYEDERVGGTGCDEKERKQRCGKTGMS